VSLSYRNEAVPQKLNKF